MNDIYGIKLVILTRHPFRAFTFNLFCTQGFASLHLALLHSGTSFLYQLNFSYFTDLSLPFISCYKNTSHFFWFLQVMTFQKNKLILKARHSVNLPYLFEKETGKIIQKEQ